MSRASRAVWSSASTSPTSRGSDRRWRFAMRRNRRASQFVNVLPMNSRWLCSSSWNSFSGVRCSLCSAQMNSSVSSSDSTYVGDADSRRWLAAIERLLALQPRLLVTGHGAISHDPARDLTLTRDYLVYLRQTMGKAVEDFVPFDEAYATTDWSRFSGLPAFEAANRTNAYGQYLLMERELLQRK